MAQDPETVAAVVGEPVATANNSHVPSPNTGGASASGAIVELRSDRRRRGQRTAL
jgi:hypothetical protein